jgi:predicted RND superfamily exporter protein
MYNFITLYQIEIRGIWEIGVFSAIGLFFLLLLTLYFIPALHALIGGEPKSVVHGTSFLISFGAKWNKTMHNIMIAVYNSLDPDIHQKFNPNKPLKRTLTLLFSVFVVAMALIAFDYYHIINKNFKFIEIKTKSLEYIPKTIVSHAASLLNKPGSSGFSQLTYLIKVDEMDFKLKRSIC